jgi:DNA topoisomerase-2
VHDGARLALRQVTYAPGLYKIFDEILVNAADNKVRDPSMDTVRVDIDQEANTIRVYNSGLGIPVEVHKEEGVYVPELIFGHLLTSSNYNDADAKVRRVWVGFVCEGGGGCLSAHGGRVCSTNKHTTPPNNTTPPPFTHTHQHNQQQITGGRNGYGAKLANIFSTRFVVETADGSRLRRFKQTFTDNMSTCALRGFFGKGLAA